MRFISGGSALVLPILQITLQNPRTYNYFIDKMQQAHSAPDDKRKHTHWIVTMNNPGEFTLANLWATRGNDIQYLCGQVEVGQQGTRHIQAYLQLKKDQRHSYLRDMFERRAHIEWCRNNEFCKDYCVKEETRVEGPWEFGQWKQNKGPHGGRTLGQLMALSHEERLTLNAPQYNSLVRAEEHWRKHLKRERGPFRYPYRTWQRQLLARLGVVEDRQIIWIYDPQGGSGKTRFGSWLGSETNSIYITIEKKENLLYMVEDYHYTIIMDVARSELEFLNYATLEKLKDGFWVNGKYEGKRVYREDPAQVIVMANQMPDTDKLSKDRWEIYRIREIPGTLDYELHYVNL